MKLGHRGSKIDKLSAGVGWRTVVMGDGERNKKGGGGRPKWEHKKKRSQRKEWFTLESERTKEADDSGRGSIRELGSGSDDV